MTLSEDVARNRASRERLGAVIERLRGNDLPLADGWTAAAVLAHLAFWDRVAATRIALYLREGKGMEFFNDVFFEYINAAGLPQWKQIPLAVAAADAVESANGADMTIERLSADELALLAKLERPSLFRRHPHRDQHLEQVERALG